MTPDDAASGSSIAVGVPIYSRTEALELLLESVPEYVDTVYVADNGPKADQERALYHRAWPFELDVIHLPHDVGIGQCRAAIAEACTEPFLWVGDCDMEFVRPGDLGLLRSILETHADLGGVAGWLIEGDTVRAGARNIREHGRTAIKSVDEPPKVTPDPVPHARFDFIPQAALIRTAAFETYSYDADVHNSEHFDFFYGHREAGEWDFASTPAVMIRHNRDIDPAYRAGRGNSHLDTEITAAKWGIEEITPGSYGEWSRRRSRPPHEQAFELFRRHTPPSVWLPARRALERVMP